MKKIFLPIVLLLSFSSSAQKLLTVEEAIATALQHNFDIQLSKNDSAVAALDYSFRNAVFLPRLNGTFNSNWNNNNQNQRFQDGTQRKLNDISSNNFNGGIQLNWVLFDGLKMFATRDKAKEFINLGELGIKNQVINTVSDVIQNYYAIVRQKQQVIAIDEQISLNEERVKLAQYKLDIGVGAKPDVLQSKVDLNAQKSAKLSQETLMTQFKEQLNQVMNVEQGSKYDVADSIPINMQLSLSTLQTNIENKNPLLLIAQKNIDIARFTLKERIAEKYPTLSFNSAYNYARTNNKATVNPFQPLFSRNFGRALGFSLSIPILNNFTTKRLIRQAELDIQFRQIEYLNQKSLLNLSVINAFNDYELQKRTLLLEEDNITLAKENVSIVFQVYKLNSTTLIQLKEAQKSLQDAQTRLINARFNTKVAETELMRLKGEIIK